MSYTVHAPAKINLSLQVLARLANGYHDLDTWMVKLDLVDILSLQLDKQPGIRLQCPDSTLPEDQSNLVWQAAAEFYNAAQLPAAIDIVLEKNIPVAAGLGGGSSDAACLLTFLNDYYGQPLSQEQLLALATTIGADLPFFVYPQLSARARGIGERLSPLPAMEDVFFVLVNPGFTVSTAWVFNHLQPPFSFQPLLDLISDNSGQTVNYALTMGGKTTILGRASIADCCEISLQNDLERVTISRYPEIQAIKESLIDHGACYAAMSGSGPTVFAIFTELSAAKDAQKGMQQELPAAKVFVTQPAQSNSSP